MAFNAIPTLQSRKLFQADSFQDLATVPLMLQQEEDNRIKAANELALSIKKLPGQHGTEASNLENEFNQKVSALADRIGTQGISREDISDVSALANRLKKLTGEGGEAWNYNNAYNEAIAYKQEMLKNPNLAPYGTQKIEDEWKRVLNDFRFRNEDGSFNPFVGSTMPNFFDLDKEIKSNFQASGFQEGFKNLKDEFKDVTNNKDFNVKYRENSDAITEMNNYLLEALASPEQIRSVAIQRGISEEQAEKHIESQVNAFTKAQLQTSYTPLGNTKSGSEGTDDSLTARKISTTDSSVKTSDLRKKISQYEKELENPNITESRRKYLNMQLNLYQGLLDKVNDLKGVRLNEIEEKFQSDLLNSIKEKYNLNDEEAVKKAEVFNDIAKKAEEAFNIYNDIFESKTKGTVDVDEEKLKFYNEYTKELRELAIKEGLLFDISKKPGRRILHAEIKRKLKELNKEASKSREDSLEDLEDEINAMFEIHATEYKKAFPANASTTNAVSKDFAHNLKTFYDQDNSMSGTNLTLTEGNEVTDLNENRSSGKSKEEILKTIFTDSDKITLSSVNMFTGEFDFTLKGEPSKVYTIKETNSQREQLLLNAALGEDFGNNIATTFPSVSDTGMGINSLNEKQAIEMNSEINSRENAFSYKSSYTAEQYPNGKNLINQSNLSNPKFNTQYLQGYNFASVVAENADEGFKLMRGNSQDGSDAKGLTFADAYGKNTISQLLDFEKRPELFKHMVELMSETLNMNFYAIKDNPDKEAEALKYKDIYQEIAENYKNGNLEAVRDLIINNNIADYEIVNRDPHVFHRLFLYSEGNSGSYSFNQNSKKKVETKNNELIDNQNVTENNEKPTFKSLNNTKKTVFNFSKSNEEKANTTLKLSKDFKNLFSDQINQSVLDTAIESFAKNLNNKNISKNAEKQNDLLIQESNNPVKTIEKIIESESEEISNNPILFAEKYLGLDEDNPLHQSTIKSFFDKAIPGWIKNPSEVNLDDKAWCAAFVYSILKDDLKQDINVKDKFDLIRAKTYMDVGEEVKDLNEAIEGDVMVIKTKNGSYHVGFYAGMKEEKPLILGGNQSGLEDRGGRGYEVNIKTLDTDSLDFYKIRRLENVKKLPEKKVNDLLNSKHLINSSAIETFR